MWVILVEYLALPTAQVAVLGPLVLSAFCLAYAAAARRLTLEPFMWAALVFPVSAMTIHWRSAAGQLSMHAFEVFGLVAVWLALHRRITPEVAYALVFLSELGLDVYGTRELFGYAGPGSLRQYYGIGGAGLVDGLFVMPVVVATGVWLLGHPRIRRGR